MSSGLSSSWLQKPEGLCHRKALAPATFLFLPIHLSKNRGHKPSNRTTEHIKAEPAKPAYMATPTDHYARTVQDVRSGRSLATSQPGCLPSKPPTASATGVPPAPRRRSAAVDERGYRHTPSACQRLFFKKPSQRLHPRKAADFRAFWRWKNEAQQRAENEKPAFPRLCLFTLHSLFAGQCGFSCARRWIW